MSDLICWGHNPGQRYVKNSITVNGKRKDLKPFPAVIAPYQSSDDLGLHRKQRDLIAKVDGAIYLGGEVAERLPMANRQLVHGRLEADSPVYQAFAQMSAQHAGFKHKPTAIIATALPVAWRTDDAEQAIIEHLKTGLKQLITVREIVVQSEPNAVVSSELLDDEGQMRKDQAELAGLVCVGDIGGGTLNRSVLEKLKVLPGQSASPLLGSRQVVEALMQASGQQYIDAERRLERAVLLANQDSLADRLLKQYQEAVIAEFQRAWASFKPNAYLFAGGTVHWVARSLERHFPRMRIVANPQQAIAVGLWRYARRRALRGT